MKKFVQIVTFRTKRLAKSTIDTTTKGTNGDSHDRTEVVWMNKHFQEALRRR